MTKKLFCLPLLFFILINLISCEKEQPVKVVDKKVIADSAVAVFEKKLISNQIDSVFKKYHFNASVAVFKDSVEVYRKNNGFSDFETKTKINNQTIFSIASISKQFTAALILLQAEQGKLNINDKVSKYLKEFQTKDYASITIHQLLNHTSGLNILGNQLMFKSGSGFYYSNDGFNALGKIVEAVSGKSYDQNVKELFNKAGMKNSSTGNLFKGKNFAQTYLGSQKNPEKIENMPKRLAGNDIGIPAGGILSTIDDLHQWNTMLYGGKILNPETLKKFTSKSAERQHPVFGKMGYGYGIMMNIGKPLAYFHSGYVKGAPSLNIYYPKTKTSVIILSNVADQEKGTAFKPHIEIKKITDLMESTVESIKSDTLKPKLL
ncbi:serine hydrolase [Chryseobacterium sp. JUb7]|uniref:serine hydrolase domain-containing protein n=1 Tax=Chryseobacterium sp. JUb7 TaxID=2940599 RepID=UPI00216A2AF3|nr:serine hydrolase domain-containing protein [Chryseobacterium sp. JUb7]MCS3530734.1 CubicO group peptidase (beta-lactamase class C family) [Chryseobacterium sp. JUb7]